jgi:hypothetical protein
VTHPLAPLVRALAAHSVQYVLIGLAGANFCAPDAGVRFVTEDFVLFLPPDPDNLVTAWASCAEAGIDLWLNEAGIDLWLNNEPLDRPRDRWLAERIIERLAVTTATGLDDLRVDFTLVMKGFHFKAVWQSGARSQLKASTYRLHACSTSFNRKKPPVATRIACSSPPIATRSSSC